MFSNYKLQGKNRTDFSVFIEPTSSFKSYYTSKNEILTNIENTKVEEIQKNTLINRVATFTTEFIGNYPHEKIQISQDESRRVLSGI